MQINIEHYIDVEEDVLPALTEEQKISLFESLAEELKDDDVLRIVTTECYAEDILDHIDEDEILNYVHDTLGYTTTAD